MYTQIQVSNLSVNEPIGEEKDSRIPKPLKIKYDSSSGWLDWLENIVWRGTQEGFMRIGSNKQRRHWILEKSLPSQITKNMLVAISSVYEFGLFFKLIASENYTVKTGSVKTELWF